MITTATPPTITSVAISLLLMALCCELRAELVVARNGQSDYTIVVGTDCSPSERYGATELQMFLKQICGARLPITDAPPTSAGRQGSIFVGRSAALDRLQLGLDFATLGDEGFVIKTVGPHLILAGGKSRGSLYACYEFLYQYLGCRWFTPSVNRIPRRETITIPAIDYRKIPALEYRDIFYQEAWDGDWSARNHVTGINSRLKTRHGGKRRYHNLHFAHTAYSLVPPDQYFGAHPEYFSEVNGKRVGKGGQLCLSNPDVLKIATAGVRQWARDEPEADIISVSETDSHGHCQCGNCRILIDREGSHAGPLLHFVNRIADNIREEFPELAVGMLAYNHMYSRIPPKHVRPRPNVVVRLVTSGCCRFHSLATCDSDFAYEGSVQFRDDITGWKNAGDSLYVWNYVADYGDFLAPLPNLHILQSDIRFFIEHNVKGIFEQGISGMPGGEFAELRSYLLARCLWQPECDWQQVMDEFLEAYYGAAATSIRAYIDLLHEQVAGSDFHSQRAQPAAYLTRAVVDRADQLFDKAAAAVADDPVLLLRVKKERLGIALTRIYRHEELLPSPEAHEAAVEAFARTAEACGISHLAEGNQRPLEKELQKWRQQVVDRRRAAEAPKANARVVGRWEIEEGTGTGIGDSAGDNDGTIHGARWSTDTPGSDSSHALAFDGRDDYVDLRQDSSEPRLETWIHPDKAFTVSLWARPEGTEHQQAAFFCGRSDRTRPFGIVFNPADHLVLVQSVATGNYALGPYVTDRWHHVAAVYKGTGRGADLYVNGVKQTTTSYTENFRAYEDLWASLVGAGSTWDNVTNQPVRNLNFSGKIDDVRLYDGVLSAAEIARSYKRRQQADLVLARRGQSSYKIAIAPDCSPSERHGADELQRFLAQICGVKLPIVHDSGTDPAIFVGNSKALERLQLEIDFATLGDEGFVIKTAGPHLVLAGGKPRGSLYACYEFLYRYLDCRWFTPKVSRIPRRETVTIPTIDYRKIPALEYRDIFYREAWDGDWSARNHVTGINSRLGPQHGGKVRFHNLHFVHTLPAAVAAEKYFQEHPEYFAFYLIDGKRHGRRGENDQLCLTNPDVADITLESVRQWLRDEPECNIVSVSEGDHGRPCECGECRALVAREGSQTGPVLHFVNQIADSIKEEFPDVAVGSLAYKHHGTRRPPRHVKPRTNVVVRMSTAEHCQFHPLTTADCAGNRHLREDTVGWSKISPRLYVWDYVANYGDILMPWPNLHALQPKIKFLVDHGAKGIFAQGISATDGSEFAALRSYILARCLWDPECDWEKEMDAFLDACYGRAAGPLRQYIDLLHQKVRRDDIHATAAPSEYLTRELVNRADELFDEAEAATADDPVSLLRVKQARMGIQLVKISRHDEFFSSLKKYEAAVSKLEQTARESGVSSLADGSRLLETELGKWRSDGEALEATGKWQTADPALRRRVEKIEATVTLQPLSPSWRFAIDPNDVGVTGKWFADAFSDNRWAVVRSDRDRGWERQGFPSYVGFGWYRGTFDVAAELEQREFLYLHFGAVDEDAYVYLNGKLVHEHSCDSTGLHPSDIWTMPFVLDVRPHLKFGQKNTVAVRVYSRGGMGGIYKPVHLIAADRKLDLYDTTGLTLYTQP